MFHCLVPDSLAPINDFVTLSALIRQGLLSKLVIARAKVYMGKNMTDILEPLLSVLVATLYNLITQSLCLDPVTLTARIQGSKLLGNSNPPGE